MEEDDYIAFFLLGVLEYSPAFENLREFTLDGECGVKLCALGICKLGHESESAMGRGCLDWDLNLADKADWRCAKLLRHEDGTISLTLEPGKPPDEIA